MASLSDISRRRTTTASGSRTGVVERRSLEQVARGMAQVAAGLAEAHQGLSSAPVPAPPLRRLEDAAGLLASLQDVMDDLILIQGLERVELNPASDVADLVTVARDAARALARRSQEGHRPLVLELDQPEARVLANAGLLARLVQSMMAFSLSHALPHKPVMVYLEEGERSTVLHTVSVGCHELPGQCPCRSMIRDEMELRLLVCRKVAWANWGWTNLRPSVGGQGLDFTLTLSRA